MLFFFLRKRTSWAEPLAVFPNRSAGDTRLLRTRVCVAGCCARGHGGLFLAREGPPPWERPRRRCLGRPRGAEDCGPLLRVITGCRYRLHFSMCACHPCAGAMLTLSVSFKSKRMIPEGNPCFTCNYRYCAIVYVCMLRFNARHSRCKLCDV